MYLSSQQKQRCCKIEPPKIVIPSYFSHLSDLFLLFRIGITAAWWGIGVWIRIRWRGVWRIWRVRRRWWRVLLILFLLFTLLQYLNFFFPLLLITFFLFDISFYYFDLSILLFLFWITTRSIFNQPSLSILISNHGFGAFILVQLLFQLLFKHYCSTWSVSVCYFIFAFVGVVTVF